MTIWTSCHEPCNINCVVIHMLQPQRGSVTVSTEGLFQFLHKSKKESNKSNKLVQFEYTTPMGSHLNKNSGSGLKRNKRPCFYLRGLTGRHDQHAFTHTSWPHYSGRSDSFEINTANPRTLKDNPALKDYIMKSYDCISNGLHPQTSNSSGIVSIINTWNTF